jgi:hypothetical protein
LIPAGASGVIYGCCRVPDAPHRLNGSGGDRVLRVVDSATEDGGRAPDSAAKYSIERHEGPDYAYSLATLEFSDAGSLWDPSALPLVDDYLHQLGRERGVVIVVFVHGWNHNGNASDENVACFRETLKAVGIMQATYHRQRANQSREVVGLYLGWRGLALEPAWLNQGVTFWNRLAAADRLGTHGDLRRVLGALQNVRRTVRPDRSKLILVGHSMGGRALFGAIGPPILETANTPATDHVAAPPSDLTVLVNPALSASGFTPFLGSRAEGVRPSEAPPRLVVMSSVRDDANGDLYPKAMRFWLWGRKFPSPTSAAQERTDIGHYLPYVTSELRVDSGSTQPVDVSAARPGECRFVRARSLGVIAGAKRADSPRALSDFRSMKIPVAGEGSRNLAPMVIRLRDNDRPRTASEPMIVRVDSAIIVDHNRFYTSPFVEFLVRLVNAAGLPPAENDGRP